MVLVVAAIVVLAIVTAYILVTKFPETTERWYRRLSRASTTAWLVFTLVVALLFISSGYWPLQLLGFAYIVVISLKVFLDLDIDLVDRVVP